MEKNTQAETKHKLNREYISGWKIKKSIRFYCWKWRLCRMKTMRKGAIVKYCGNRKEFVETWGELFEVYHKEGNFLKLISLKKPYFDVCASVPCKDCELVEE